MIAESVVARCDEGHIPPAGADFLGRAGFCHAGIRALPAAASGQTASAKLVPVF
jgi:hypothetical protein